MRKLDHIPHLGAAELRRRLAEGSLKAVDVASAFLAQVQAKEAAIGAFAWFDAAHVLEQARALDAWKATGRPVGPLHGLPVAVKDIVDTRMIPTENGTPIDKGRVPRKDAAIVTQLKQAGAIIFGKTVTTELAFLAPSATKNPWNAAHTPGGSSSGSAAAVAAGMVPLAIGTQTGGSVIRPASFCGVVGFKPSFGAIARTGILAQSPTLDTVGVFARTVEDAALLADALFGHDADDPATAPAPGQRLFDTATDRPPVTPALAFYRLPGFDRADPQMLAALEEMTGLLDERCFEITLPNLFAEADAQRKIIHFAEMAKCYYGYEKRGAELLSPEMAEVMAAGKATLARDYIAALDWRRLMNAALDEVFDRCDAILAPAALGPAPADLTTTGDPVFNGIWTLAGTPVVSVPLFMSGEGMPMGLQVIGRSGSDGRLLRTARWLAAELAAAAPAESPVAASHEALRDTRRRAR